MAEFGVASAAKALEDAGLSGADIDLVICAASHHQRPYPALGIEIQNAIGAGGAAFAKGLGCSSAAAGLHVAANLVKAGAQRRVLVGTPEMITAHLDFRDRQTHFIFGDASTAVLVERMDGSGAVLVGASTLAAGYFTAPAPNDTVDTQPRRPATRQATAITAAS